ncbi:SMP-30/gluconolactonase/LRE family protein [Euzebya tangerina]|uniref:SMP-30/gluconolactonase/LRE family protein n=1 Tax=Euzebya tangerina TaxID=591198 RepID=UPI00196AE607|nr:SMP-30/gluconolactonase/LRE family protein [Euzebya tangerina]
MAHTDVPKPPVDPQVWTPPPDPGLTGLYERNDVLAEAEFWPVPDQGPEDVAVTSDGVVFTGTLDSSILRISHGGDRIERVVRTGGRPLGIEILPDGRVLVCDTHRGLLAIDPDRGAIEELVTEVGGERLICTNNAAVARDGSIYFSDSSRRFPVEHYKGDIIEHSGTGRLLRRAPDGTVETLLDGLQFANGVALSPDEEFVLVAETGAYEIRRLWLEGPMAGRSETFATMPGFPDNLSTGPTGTFWCAAASDRNGLLDSLFPKHPSLRKAVWNLPDALQPAPAKMALVFGYDSNGTLTHNLQVHGGDFIVATGAREHDGHLYVGSLESRGILRHRL